MDHDRNKPRHNRGIGTETVPGVIADENTREDRIRKRALQIWLDAGKPQGREREYWDIARLAVARQDILLSMTKPVRPPSPALLEAVRSQGEYAKLLDQEESETPGRAGDS